MLNVVILNIVLLNVIILSVVGPKWQLDALYSSTVNPCVSSIQFVRLGLEFHKSGVDASLASKFQTRMYAVG